MQIFQPLADSLAALIGPRCALCRCRAGVDGLCPDCRGDVPRLVGDLCPVCSLPVAGGLVCGRCLRSPPRFDGVAAACRYEFPVDALVRALKYRGELAAARPLASLLASRVLSEPEPDLVVPMPLSATRERERGFNQALVLARCLPPRWAVRVDVRPLRRIADAPPQAGLDLEARIRNVRQAFRAERDLAGARIALVDDVMTTGATLGAAADALKRAGAREVRGWVVARTLDRR